MTLEHLRLQIEGVESNITNITKMIEDKKKAKERDINHWDEEISHLKIFLKENENLLATLKNNLV